MSSEKFCLRWNDFESHISGSFKEIRDAKDFFDVTLVCEEEQIQAHKVIISACSPFFRNILRKNPHQHPLLYLKGVKFPELQSVLAFMYHGEANIAQDDLNSFLSVAEELQVKGLTQNSAGGSKTESNPVKMPVREPNPPPVKRQKLSLSTSNRSPEDDDIQEIMPVVKTEPQTSTAAPRTDYYPAAAAQSLDQSQSLENQIAEYGEESYDNYEDYDTDQNYGVTPAGQNYDTKDGDSTLDAKIDSLITRTDTGDLCCMVCGRSSNNRTNIRNHVETHVADVRFNCDLCGKQYKTRNSLSVHKSLHHKNLNQV